jgi:hypothetical protein
MDQVPDSAQLGRKNSAKRSACGKADPTQARPEEKDLSTFCPSRLDR